MALEEAAEMAGVVIMLAGISMAVRIVQAGGRVTIGLHTVDDVRDHAAIAPGDSASVPQDRSQLTVSTP
jgi:hypothetical protein